jgi:hypothetical protein
MSAMRRFFHQSIAKRRLKGQKHFELRLAVDKKPQIFML